MSKRPERLLRPTHFWWDSHCQPFHRRWWIISFFWWRFYS